MADTALQQEALRALRQVYDPDLGIDIVELGLVVSVEQEPGRLRVGIRPTSPLCPAKETIRAEAEAALEGAFPGAAVQVFLTRAPGAALVAPPTAPPAAAPSSSSSTLALWAVPLAVLSVVLGVLGGLLRLGWPLPVPASAVGLHGILMVVGFFGTVIGLERALALGNRSGLVAPLLMGLGAILGLLGAPPAGALMTLGTLAMTVQIGVITREQPSGGLLAGAVGAACLLVGTAGWSLGLMIAQVVPCWIAFLVLTVAGERLDLAALVKTSPRTALELGLVAALVAGGALLALVLPGPGQVVVGLGLLSCAGWLTLRDPGWRGLAHAGGARLAAVAMLAGQIWLAVAGAGLLLAAAQAPVLGGSVYDLVLHAVFLGFAISMVFAHAPTIFPLLTGLQVRAHAGLYLPLALLHLGLVWRFLPVAALGGDRAVGGLISAIAMALFPPLLLASLLWRPSSEPSRVRSASSASAPKPI